MEIINELFIDAPVERVWELTIDVERWPAMTPTITSVTRGESGPLQVGSTAAVKQPGQRAAIWTVSELRQGQVFEWRTKVLSIEMVGRHHLQPEGSGCRNILSLDVNGFGSGLAKALVGRRIQQAIATENRGFKTAAEGAG